MAQIQGVTSFGTRPTPTGESVATPTSVRMDKYNGLAVSNYYPDAYACALEGSYFIASTPTPNTAISATTSLTNFASGGTKPYIVMLNNNVAGGPNVELDYLKLIVVGLPTTATNQQIAITLDTAANKLPTTAGTAITPVNVNPLSTISSNCSIQAGAITTAADSGFARLVFQDFTEPGTAATPCAVLGDTYVAKFGSIEHASGSGALQPVAAGTPLASKIITGGGPPIIAPPGWAIVVKLFGIGTAAAPSFLFELGYRER